jgi:hypothetical protein
MTLIELFVILFKGLVSILFMIVVGRLEYPKFIPKQHPKDIFPPPAVARVLAKSPLMRHIVSIRVHGVVGFLSGTLRVQISFFL